MQGKIGEPHCPGLHRQAAQAQAEQILAEELARRGWEEAELKQRRMNDPEKLEITARLRRETILSIKAIGTRLFLATSKGAAANLHRHLRRSSGTAASKPMLGL